MLNHGYCSGNSFQHISAQLHNKRCGNRINAGFFNVIIQDIAVNWCILISPDTFQASACKDPNTFLVDLMNGLDVINPGCVLY